MGREKNVDIDIEKLYKSIIWSVRFDDIPLVFKGDEEAVKAFQEFQIKMTKYQSNKELNQDEFSKTIQDFIRNCVSKYKDKIDEEALLMIFLYNSRDELQRISKEEDIRNPNVQSAYKQISDNIQVALNIETREKNIQESRPLNCIGDNFKKIIVVKDNIKHWISEDGILIISVQEFLLDKNSLDL